MMIRFGIQSACLGMLTMCAAIPVSQAELRLEIVSGVTEPIPIAIVPFAASSSEGGMDVSEIVMRDLAGSGRFRILPRSRIRATPRRGQDLNLSDWKADGIQYVAVGRVSSVPGGQGAIDYELVNVLTAHTVLTHRITSTAAAHRNAAHRVSDTIYEKILGVRGAFATRIAYVAVDGTSSAPRYRLLVADADGENGRVIVESRFPLMSPAWSRDGERLAYVSFEQRRSAVYIQRLRSGERTRVSQRAGINGAPSFSPDGKKLALTLSGSLGNPDIYVLDLNSQQLKRITDDPAIDSEAEWSADGRSLVFMSDRSGGPQIYQVGLSPGDRPKRLTFGSPYSARPRLSPDGRMLAMLTVDRGDYRIAVQDLTDGSVRVLSKGRQDESPSFAPNGQTLVYSGQEGGRSVLATVSADGLVGQRLQSNREHVREPAWAPFSQ